VFVTFQIILINICALLGYYVAYIGNILPKLRDKVMIYFHRSRNQRNPLLFGYLDPLNGLNKLSRNVDNVIPLCAQRYQIVAPILFPSHKKPNITHFNSLSKAIYWIVRKIIVAVYSYVLLYLNVVHMYLSGSNCERGWWHYVTFWMLWLLCGQKTEKRNG
jgi:hypothetical protein